MSDAATETLGSTPGAAGEGVTNAAPPAPPERGISNEQADAYLEERLGSRVRLKLDLKAKRKQFKDAGFGDQITASGLIYEKMAELEAECAKLAAAVTDASEKLDQVLDLLTAKGKK